MNSFFKILLSLSLIFGLGLPVIAYGSYQAKGWQGIIIQQLLPNPVDKDAGKEWVKLYNSSNTQVNLRDWVLMDSFGKTNFFVFTDDLWLEDDDYLILPRSQTNIILNNFEEQLSLFNSNGDLADQVTYLNAPAGETLSYKQSQWAWSGNKTASSSAGNRQDLDLNWEELNQGQTGQKFIVQGKVLSLPGQLGSQYFLLSQNDQQSLTTQIYNYDKNFPKLELGDYIQVTGTFSKINNYFRIKTQEKEDIKVLETASAIIPIAITKNTDLNNYLNKLVSLGGQITDKDGTYYIMEDKIKLNLTLIENKPALNEKFTVNGIVLKSNNLAYIKALPSQQDKLEASQPPKQYSNKNIIPKLAISALGTLSVIGALSLKRRR